MRFISCGNDLVTTYAGKKVLPLPGALSLEILVFTGGGRGTRSAVVTTYAPWFVTGIS